MDLFTIGIFYSIIAGFLLVFQGIFNAGLGDSIGQWEATTMVHLIGFIVALLITLFVGKGSMSGLKTVNKIFITGGALGVIIVYSTMIGVSNLGASLSVALMVITQLGFATIVDAIGLFGLDKIPITLNKIIGFLVMALGIIIFQFGDKIL